VSPGVYAQAVLTNTTKLKILLVNKKNGPSCVLFDKQISGDLWTVDIDTGDHPATRTSFSSTKLAMSPFGVYVIDVQ